MKSGRLDFKKLNGIIPVIVQEAKSKKVLMLGFMNKDALKKTIKTGRVTYFSRSRNRLWTKGETSGNFQMTKKIWKDCDSDTLLIEVRQLGSGACHTGAKTCFYQELITPQKNASN